MKVRPAGNKILIVNADDCNLTAGVTSAILKAHDLGILSSTTFMANLPVRKPELRRLLSRKHLGIGSHLNVTLGRPVSSSVQVRSLLTPEGSFRKRDSMLAVLPARGELEREYANQILLFKKYFKRLPTHLDTHHQLHDHPFFLKVLTTVARKFKVPLRRSALMPRSPVGRRASWHGLPVTDYIWGDLNPKGYWRFAALRRVLQNLKPGVHEIMCHPGKIDNNLRALSSFTRGRDREADLFSSPALRTVLKKNGIQLSHYGMCYTWNKHSPKNP